MKNNISVLYVDDEYMNLLLFDELLKSKYDIRTAESGLEGLEILKECPKIDVVVSDMKMPMMSGIEFIKEASELYPSAVFFIVTGFEITKEINEALQKGLIKKYFQKPFRMEDIDTEIQRTISIH